MLSRATAATVAPRTNPATTQALRHELGAAGDDKISKIIAFVDQVGDAEINRTLLDPVRNRLAALRPARPLRFSRLLFMPLDPLIVPARNWRVSDCRVPRTVLGPVSRLVQTALDHHPTNHGQQSEDPLRSENARQPPGVFVSKTIAGRTLDDADAITRAGEILWPLAADILATASPPADWVETALPITVFRPLMGAIAAVLRRGPTLRRLQQDAENGLTDRDEVTIAAIMAGLADEPLKGGTMVTQLILVQAPHAAPLLRRYVSSTREAVEAAALNKAMANGIEESLAYLENEATFTRSIESASLRPAGEQVRMTASLLMAIESDTAATRYRMRVRALKDRLDQASQTCFSNNLKKHLIDRLAARGSDNTAQQESGQRQLEASARELRMLEAVARYASDTTSYQRQLKQAADLVQTTMATTGVTTIRACRLIEILCGPEAAEALYRRRAKQPEVVAM